MTVELFPVFDCQLTSDIKLAPVQCELNNTDYLGEIIHRPCVCLCGQNARLQSHLKVNTAQTTRKGATYYCSMCY